MVKIKICIEQGCKNAQTTKDYCRLHYLKNWKSIKEVAQKKAADRLNKYVDGICNKHPDKYVDVVRRDIRQGKGDQVKAVDEGMTGNHGEGFSEDLGFENDEGLDRLLTNIKLDKNY